jgi:hypothetical protein
MASATGPGEQLRVLRSQSGALRRLPPPRSQEPCREPAPENGRSQGLEKGGTCIPFCFAHSWL